MFSTQLDIKTKDGVCDSFVAFPRADQKFPAVLLLMDAFGLRTYLFEMAEHLASLGYFVLVPNLFYRIKRAPVIDVNFPLRREQMPEARKQLAPLFGSFDPEKALADIKDFISYLHEQINVEPGKIGLTGYCMGGGLALRAAARFKDQIGAVASFHAGRLVSDSPNSVHTLLKDIKAKIYVAHADHDESMPAEQIRVFNEALAKSGTDYEVELYKEALHGYTMKDLPAYNAQALQRHWTKLQDLFRRQALDL